MEFRDLKKQYIKYKYKIDKAVQEVFNETNFINGQQVKKLESNLAEYVGVKHCISCANGTDALSLVLTAWGIGKGDAVFVPDFTYFATAEVVSYAGATPIFVDVETETFNIDVNDLDLKIQEMLNEGLLKPKVIIPVDLFGLLANYDQIEIIAKKYNLLILEDAAQGFGATYKNKKACSFGHAATTSFFPAKPLGCYGDGGAIFTNDDELAKLLKSLRVHGTGKDKYDNVRIGVNSRLDTVQAAILNIKLDAFIKHELEDVNKVHTLYNQYLKDYVKVPIIPIDFKSSFAQYTIILKSQESRDGLKKYLTSKNIPSFIYYNKPMHKQEAFKELNVNSNKLKNSLFLSERVLSLPMHPYLTKNEIRLISSSVINYLQNEKV